MPNYRRAFIPGGCWFFTVNLLDRAQSLLVDHIEKLRGAVAATGRHYPFEIDAFVVLPDHLHAVLTLPPHDADFSTRWRLIKARFARSLRRNERLSAVRVARGERGIWQRRFWEHLVRDEADYARHVEYCYINPVKHGKGWRLAAFVVSPRRAPGRFPSRLGGRRVRDRQVRGSVGRNIEAYCVVAATTAAVVGTAADGVLRFANPPYELAQQKDWKKPGRTIKIRPDADD